MNRQVIGIVTGTLCVAGVLPALAVSQMTKTDEGIVVNVDQNETKTWSDLYPADGLDCAGQLLIKIGAGTFKPTGTAIQTAGIEGVEIRGGRYSAEADAEFGVEAKPVTVKSGATLILTRANDGAENIKSRTLTIEGVGSSATYPAVRIEGGGWNKMSSIKWELSGDATVYLTSSEVWAFRYSQRISTGGNALTLSGPGKFVFTNGAQWAGGGQLAVGEGTTITADAQPSSDWTYRSTDGKYPVVTFAAKASLKPATAEFFNLAKKCVFANESVLAPSASIAVPIEELTGTPFVSENVASLTIAKAFAVDQADILAGHALTATNDIVFGASCTFAVNGFSSEMVTVASGSEYTLVKAGGTISGTPALTGRVADYFTLANTGSELILVRKAYTGTLVSLCDDLGVAPGEENSSANAAALAANLPSLGAGAVVLTDPGEYWFDEKCDLTALTAQGVTFRSLFSDDPAIFHSPIEVGEAENVAVESLTVSGTTGPAVVANGTQGLAVRNCRLVDVVGAWTDGKAYPFAFTDVTASEVSGCTYEFQTSPAWAAQAYLDGGTQNPLSEAQVDAFVVSAKSGETKIWAQAVAASGLASTAFAGRQLIKVGSGEFYPKDEGAAMQAAGISNVIVRAGWYSAKAGNEFGNAKGMIKVEDGGTLIMKGASQLLSSRRVEVAGCGSSPEYPAVRVETSWGGQVDGGSWVLNDDATFYNAKSGLGENDGVLFQYSSIYGNGHTLTLNGVAGSSFRMYKGVFWYAGGTLVVGEGVQLRASADAGAGQWWQYSVKSGSTPEFVFRDGATFAPENADIFKLAKWLTFEGTSAFSPGNAIAVAVDELTGAPTLSANVTALTVNSSYTLRKDDVAADKYLDCLGTLSFGTNAAIDIDTAADLAGKIAFHAAGGVFGAPKSTAKLKSAGVRVSRADANTWKFAGNGIVLIVR